MFIASAQKLFGSPPFSLKHIAHSAIVCSSSLLHHSAAVFYKLCNIIEYHAPHRILKTMNLSTLYQFILRCLIFLPIWFFTSTFHNLNLPKASNLCFIKYIQTFSTEIINVSNEILISTFRQLPYWSPNIKLHIIKNVFCLVLSRNPACMILLPSTNSSYESSIIQHSPMCPSHICHRRVLSDLYSTIATPPTFVQSQRFFHCQSSTF